MKTKGKVLEGRKIINIHEVNSLKEAKELLEQLQDLVFEREDEIEKLNESHKKSINRLLNLKEKRIIEIKKLVREDIIAGMKRMRDKREGTRLSWDLRTMMEVIKIIKKGEVKQ
ncbi:MAG: hypothetical protein KKD77_22325 [Gammaproteobacteria bacterium]|nr:hypothetical protein [Gammaproteobacteria bacterium]